MPNVEIRLDGISHVYIQMSQIPRIGEKLMNIIYDSDSSKEYIIYDVMWLVAMEEKEDQSDNVVVYCASLE